MSLNSQFSLASELSNVFPIRSVVDSGINWLIQFARDLRKSGSDIVVEEDLAAVFGRGIINSDLEDKFKELVRIQSFLPLYPGSAVRLDSGPGPSMQRALKERRYMATIIQLSFLAWMQPRKILARMLSECMKTRLDIGVRDASNPGSEGISSTLAACSSQTSTFAWNFYVQKVEERLHSCISGYQFHQDYTNIPENVLLGAMDYLFLIQSLPDQRKVVVSNQAGSITLIIWAHYLLDLTVVIMSAKTPRSNIIFEGASKEHQITIYWQECEDHSGDSNSNFVSHCAARQTDIRLLDSDTSVTLQSLDGQEGDRLMGSSRDRHPLIAYGTASLYRMLNSTTITSENDPIYEDSVKLIIALAIHVSSRLGRSLDSYWREEEQYRQLPRYDICIEVWRVLNAAKIIFSGIKQNSAGIASYADFLADNGLDDTNIPANFQNYIKKAQERDRSITHVKTFLKKVRYLAQVVLLFSCVVDVESCAEMPIMMDIALVEVEKEVISACRNPKGHPMIAPQMIFFGLV